MNLLHIDSSILGANSVSRMLSAEIVERQRKLHAGLEVVSHDLAAHPAMHLSPAHIAAWHGTPPTDEAVQKDLEAGSASIAELFAADIIVIGAPMYNFTIPSQLKSWIDRVLVAGKTFHYTANGPEGLLPPGKKVFIASSRGGAYAPSTPMAFLDHQESYLRAALGLIGLKDVTIIRAEGLAMGAEAREAALATARHEIAAVAA